MPDRRDDDAPPLHEAWQLFDQRIGGGLRITPTDEHGVHVDGVVRGRAVAVDVVGARSGNQALRELFHQPGRMRHDARTVWQSQLVVACHAPASLVGTIDSWVDTNSPSWDPRVYDPRNGRIVRADPPALAATVLSPSIVDRLSGIIEDVRIVVGTESIGLRHEGTSSVDGGYVAGSVLHHPIGPVVPWPDRAIVGPWFWFGVLYDIADLLERAVTR
jgi:hypothetical protein